MADAAQNLRPVLLDGGAARAAAVAALPAGKVDRYLVRGQRQSGRYTLDDRRQGGAVRFSGSQESEPAHLVGLGGLRGGPATGRISRSVRVAAGAHVHRKLAHALLAGPVQLGLHDLDRRGLARPELEGLGSLL